MASPENIGRVLFRHDWREPLEWARAIDKLADLHDDDIGRLIRNVLRERPESSRCGTGGRPPQG